MKTYSFKSSGKTQTQKKVEEIEKSKLPIGVKTPIELSSGQSDDVFVMHTKIEDVISDNLKNLILTNWGERLGFHNFGANLTPLMSETADIDLFDSEAITRISATVTRWMPFVELLDYRSSVKTKNEDRLLYVRITITYSLPVIDVQDRSLDINLYAM
jgi:phage baseplate assembly protein W